MTLDAIIAQKIGALVVENARQAVIIEALKSEIERRDQAIAELRQASLVREIGGAREGVKNGASH